MRVEDVCSYILYYDAKIDIFFYFNRTFSWLNADFLLLLHIYKTAYCFSFVFICIAEKQGLKLKE